MANIEKFARFIAVYVYSVVLANDGLLTNKELWETVKIDNLHFDPETMREQCSNLAKRRSTKSAKIPNQFVSLFRSTAPRTSGEAAEAAGPSKLSIVASAKHA